MKSVCDFITIQTGKNHVEPIFSRDSRWLAFQDNELVYLADIRAKQPEFIKLKPPEAVNKFEPCDIAPGGSALLATVPPVQSGREERVIWRIEAMAKCSRPAERHF